MRLVLFIKISSSVTSLTIYKIKLKLQNYIKLKKKKKKRDPHRQVLFKCFRGKERRKIRDPRMEQRTNKGDGSRNCY